MLEHESILVFGESAVSFFPQKQERTESGKQMIRAGIKSKASKGEDVYGGLNQGYYNGANDPEMRFPSSVQNFNRERGLHPTQKPLALLEYLVRTYTNEGDTVLDFTMGSGTALVASVATGRRCVGIEKEREYCDIAIKRLESGIQLEGIR